MKSTYLVVEVIRQFTASIMEADPVKMPNYRMMLILRNAMINRGFSMEETAKILASMTISMTEEIMADQPLVTELAEAMATIMRKMADQMERDFPGHGETMLVAMARDFKLEF
jgi:hypothetical protein